jgi:hypothetical protein
LARLSNQGKRKMEDAIMPRCMDCFAIAPRVPGTLICSQCYAKRVVIDAAFMSKRPVGEALAAQVMERNRLAAQVMKRDQERASSLPKILKMEQAKLATKIEREWTPPLQKILKEAS